MKDHYIEKSTAISAGEAGWDKKTNKAYFTHEEDTVLLWTFGEPITELIAYAPTQTQIRDWLWEEHEIWIGIGLSRRGFFLGQVDYLGEDRIELIAHFGGSNMVTPYKAIERGIKIALSHIIKKRKRCLNF